MRSQNIFSGEHFYDGVKEARFTPRFALLILIFLVIFEVMTFIPAAFGKILMLWTDGLFPADTAENRILTVSLLSESITGARVIF